MGLANNGSARKMALPCFALGQSPTEKPTMFFLDHYHFPKISRKIGAKSPHSQGMAKEQIVSCALIDEDAQSYGHRHLQLARFGPEPNIDTGWWFQPSW